MKNIIGLLLASFTLMQLGITHIAFAQLQSVNVAAYLKNSPLQFRTTQLSFDETSAVGALQVFPFGNLSKDISCTATHLGDGLMLTTGHCFLGAWACNNARVTFFLEENSNRTWVSRCEEVIAISADDSRYLSTHQDYALFRISNPPPVAASLELNEKTQAGQQLTAVSFPRPTDSRTAKRIVTGSCSASQIQGQDYFGHARSEFTFFNDCALPSGSNGAPLFNLSTHKIVGLHQGLFAIPERNISSPNSPRFFNPSKQIAQSPLATMLNFTLQAYFANRAKLNFPKLVSVGNFATESFPSGLPGNLKLHVATLEAEAGLDTVSFEVRNGSETEVHIFDATQKHFVIKGMTATLNDVRVQYKAPVRIEARTAKSARTVSVLIENIQSP